MGVRVPSGVPLFLYKGVCIVALNKGYLTAKTDKASDEVFTPEYAVLPLIKYLTLFNP